MCEICKMLTGKLNGQCLHCHHQCVKVGNAAVLTKLLPVVLVVRRNSSTRSLRRQPSILGWGGAVPL
jgi:hypothetical protein